MNAPLAGTTIVVTRPAAQSRRFTELATRAGAECVAYPTLEIERLALDTETREEVAAHAPWDWAIYTSVNAVDVAFDELPDHSSRRTAAIGRATARALEARGIAVELRPEAANSEGLLALPSLQAVSGQRVLLVKGAGGRDLLAETLHARGALVRALEVYRRTVASPSAATQSTLRATLARTDTRRVVAVTSSEVLTALLQLAGAGQAAALRAATLLLPGVRVASVAAAAGWTGPIVQASTAEDEAMVRALQDWVAGAPPAA